MRKLNFSLIFIITAFLLVLTIPSFFAAWAEDEGTLGSNFIWRLFAKLFLILRFPTHTLLWTFFSNGGFFVYLAGLLINCLFYAFLFERFISFANIQLKKNKR